VVLLQPAQHGRSWPWVEIGLFRVSRGEADEAPRGQLPSPCRRREVQQFNSSTCRPQHPVHTAHFTATARQGRHWKPVTGRGSPATPCCASSLGPLFLFLVSWRKEQRAERGCWVGGGEDAEKRGRLWGRARHDRSRPLKSTWNLELEPLHGSPQAFSPDLAVQLGSEIGPFPNVSTGVASQSPAD
jgi:hypothetical protein